MPFSLVKLDREHFSFGVRNNDTEDVDWFETEKEAKEVLKKVSETEKKTNAHKI